MEMDRNTERWLTSDVLWVQSHTWSRIVNMFTLDCGGVGANDLGRAMMEEGELWHWD